jgi:hypothetical protein
MSSIIICNFKNITGVIKSRMIWAGNVVCMGTMNNACRSLVGKPERGETT